MFTIFWRTIKDRKISLIIYCLAAVLFLWMYVAMFPSIQGQSEAFTKAYESFPEAFYEAFGIEELNISTIENFLAIEHFSMIWPIMAIIMLMAIGGTGIAGEIERGTAEILLSRPVSRLKLFFARYSVGLFSLLVFTIVSIFAIVPLAELHNVDYILENFVSVAIISFLFGWAVLSVAMLFSVFFSERSRVYMVSGGILLVMYVLSIVAALRENLNNLRYLSFFHYYNYNDALIRHTIDSTDVFVFIGVIVVCTVIAAIWFKKRDIAV